jgi:hypothetical protein
MAGSGGAKSGRLLRGGPGPYRPPVRGAVQAGSHDHRPARLYAIFGTGVEALAPWKNGSDSLNAIPMETFKRGHTPHD